jgi:hypothetical protein
VKPFKFLFAGCDCRRQARVCNLALASLFVQCCGKIQKVLISLGLLCPLTGMVL